MKSLVGIMQRSWLIIALFALLPACQTTSIGVKVAAPEGVEIPFMKNAATECYFLDDFMPVPDRLVTGKHGSIGLRYYSYNTANYKDWDPRRKVILSFYSVDNRCWSLFEEYMVTR
jgi:hypothetical protein